MSVINLYANDVWSEADIMAHGRAVIESHVSVARQDELRTIMLGHIAGMRTASPDELAEIALVQQVTEQQATDNAAARADNALLAAVLVYESALARLAQPEVTEPATVIVDEVEVPNPALEQDAAERADATIKVANVSVEALALYTLRNPVIEPVEVPNALVA
jgi:NAD(P)H-dependent flavin oxidoreductase YrpB (nitropropane dioxygenase family)